MVPNSIQNLIYVVLLLDIYVFMLILFRGMSYALNTTIFGSEHLSTVGTESNGISQTEIK